MGETARIDHRSHAARCLTELPTVHEGVTARTMERKGYTADRCELNRQIKADNAFLRELRCQRERIAKAVLDTIPAISRELTQRINTLAEEQEDLRTERNRILASFNLADDKGMAEIRKWTKQWEAVIQTLNAQESRCQTELNTALEEYKTLSTHAANFDSQALWPERLRERENLNSEARTELKTRLGADYSERRLDFAEQRLREMLSEEGRELRQYGKERHRVTPNARKTPRSNLNKNITR